MRAGDLEISVAATVLGVLFVVACACCGVLARKLWRARGAHAVEVRAREMLVRTAHEAYEQLHWHRWWLRNACEMTPLDALRPHLIRLALASLLVDDLAQYIGALHRLADDSERSDQERAAARAICGEFEAPIRPWDPSQRLALDADGQIVHAPEKPEHSAWRLREVLRHALASWTALLVPGASGDDDAPEKRH